MLIVLIKLIMYSYKIVPRLGHEGRLVVANRGKPKSIGKKQESVPH